VLTAAPGDGDGDLFAEVGQRLAAQAAGSSHTQLPVPEDYAGSPLAGRRQLATVAVESARLRARLQGLVQASRLDRPRSVRRGRRLHPRRLHRVAVGEARVFHQKAPRRAPNTAVHLLVDLSGSMSDEVVRKDGTLTWRSTLAQESALALALALTGIPGVTVAATAFPGRAGSPERVTRMLRPGQSVRDAAGAFLQHPRGGTPLAQALWYAAAELLARREQRRLLMVLTDGAPDDAREAARLLTLARAAGIETVGIGIGVEVRQLFVTALTVHATTDLKDALFGVAEQLLVGAAA
jgi:cobalamin biosynthesis protein CobT